MNKTSLTRYALLGAIAALGFMLLTEWVQFRDEHQRQRVAATATPATSQALPVPAAPASETPAVPATGNVDAAAIPLPQASTEAAAPAPSKTIVAQDSSLIRVQTDVLDLLIDPQGGDIVYAALRAHPARLDTPEQAFVLLNRTPAHTYIAHSGLVSANGTAINPLFQSEQREFLLADGQDTLNIDLVHDDGQQRILKRFSLNRSDYLINLEYRVENRSDTPWQAALYGFLKRDSHSDPSADSGHMGVAPFLGIASTTADERFKKIAFDDVAKENFQTRNSQGWIAVIQHYFLSAWIPPAGTSTDYSAIQSEGFNFARFVLPLTTVAPQTEGVFNASLYVGPKDQYRLETIAPNLDLSVDYGFLWWIAQPLFWLLNELHKLLGNWGFAIIALTIIIKLVFYPLSAASYRSMANMRRVAPKLAELKERFGDDRQKMSQAMMELYRKEKINPMGGCLPILVQMPVFIALYWVLLESVELRQAPFIGYIKDLSVMDPYFILPIIMGASMFIQQKLNPAPPDPLQAKIMQWLPVVFTFFFLWFPAGLVLYWVVNNILSIAQQWFITKKIENAAEKAAGKA